jgi:hypothetical protein
MKKSEQRTVTHGRVTHGFRRGCPASIRLNPPKVIAGTLA